MTSKELLLNEIGPRDALFTKSPLKKTTFLTTVKSTSDLTLWAMESSYRTWHRVAFKMLSVIMAFLKPPRVQIIFTKIRHILCKTI